MTDTPFTRDLLRALYSRNAREHDQVISECKENQTLDGEPVDRLLELRLGLLDIAYKVSKLDHETDHDNPSSVLMTKDEQVLAKELGYPGFDPARLKRLTVGEPEKKSARRTKRLN